MEQRVYGRTHTNSSWGRVTNEYSSVMGLYTYGLILFMGPQVNFTSLLLLEDPMYIISLFHLNSSSGVVDGGSISDQIVLSWRLGSPIADMGMYGGPTELVLGRWFSVSPSFGAPTTSISVPQDQGSNVLLLGMFDMGRL